MDRKLYPRMKQPSTALPPKGRSAPADMPMMPLGAFSVATGSSSGPAAVIGGMASSSTVSSTTGSGVPPQFGFGRSESLKRGPVNVASAGSSAPPKKSKGDGEGDVGIVIEGPGSLLTQVIEAEVAGATDRIEPLLSAAVKALKGTRGKPEMSQALSLVILARTRPQLFRSGDLLDLLMSILRKEFNVTAVKVVKIPSANNPQVQILTANLLYSILREENIWTSLVIANNTPGSTIVPPPTNPLLNQLFDLHEDNYAPLPIQFLCELLLSQIYDEEVSSSSSNLSKEGGKEDTTRVEQAGGGTKSESSKQQSDKMKAEKDKRRKLRKLVSYLWNLLNVEQPAFSDDKSKSITESYYDTDVREVVDFLTKRLGCQSPLIRSIAIKALRLILSQDGQSRLEQMFTADNNSQSAMDDDSEDIKGDFDFLENLMTLKCFDCVKDTVCESLKWALLVETNPAAVCKFVWFLSNNSNPGDASISEAVAHLLIDRPSLVRVLTADNLRYKDTFITACSRLFISHLRSVKRRHDGEPQYNWSNSQDSVLVTWESGESAVLRITVIHAMVILLTLGPVSGREDLFDQLMNTWIPPPPSYLVDTSEEALLLPDWLKLKLLRSTHPVLVEAALKDLDSSQLVLFIQSFGLPPSSMERLLQALDDCCEEDEETVRSCIPDEKFMRHLIEVQWMRGVRSGYKFATMLGVDKPPSTSVYPYPKTSDQQQHKTSFSSGMFAASSSSASLSSKESFMTKNTKVGGSGSDRESELHQEQVGKRRGVGVGGIVGQQQQQQQQKLQQPHQHQHLHSSSNILLSEFLRSIMLSARQPQVTTKPNEEDNNQRSSMSMLSRKQEMEVYNFLSNYSKTIGSKLFKASSSSSSPTKATDKGEGTTTTEAERFILDIKSLLNGEYGTDLEQMVTQLILNGFLNSLFILIGSYCRRALTLSDECDLSSNLSSQQSQTGKDRASGSGKKKGKSTTSSSTVKSLVTSVKDLLSLLSTRREWSASAVYSSVCQILRFNPGNDNNNGGGITTFPTSKTTMPVVVSGSRTNDYPTATKGGGEGMMKVFTTPFCEKGKHEQQLSTLTKKNKDIMGEIKTSREDEVSLTRRGKRTEFESESGNRKVTVKKEDEGGVVHHPFGTLSLSGIKKEGERLPAFESQEHEEDDQMVAEKLSSLSDQVERSVRNSRDVSHFLLSEVDLMADGVDQLIFGRRRRGNLVNRKRQIENENNVNRLQDDNDEDNKEYLLPLLLHKTSFSTIQLFIQKLLSPLSARIAAEQSIDRRSTTRSEGHKGRVIQTIGGNRIDHDSDSNGRQIERMEEDTSSTEQLNDADRMEVNGIGYEGVVEYEPKLVLDFITAVLDSPRLWMGRELKRPNHFVLEDVLNLNASQVDRLVDYIIQEGRAESRVDLLLRSCLVKETHIRRVLTKLAGIAQSEPSIGESVRLPPTTIPSSSQQSQLMMTTAVEEGQEDDKRRRMTSSVDKNNMTPLPSSLISRLPASSFDLNLWRQELTTFLRSLSLSPSCY